MNAIPYPGQSTTPGQSACPPEGPGHAICPALRSVTQAVIAVVNPPVGELTALTPATLQAMYGLPAGGNGQTIAVVVAYDDPVAESDLAVYRQEFGLSACTSANGCFSKVAGNGSSSLPPVDYNWAVEASLDLDTASAACPACHIMLVEATSDLFSDLGQAVDTAVTHGATEVSNSYGAPEAQDNVSYDSHYRHPGVPITAAAGDDGYGVQFPASSQYVTAVGGTQLVIFASSFGAMVWTQTGAGCSQFIPKPSWQHDTGCPNRTANDVAVIADPNEGLFVYDSVLNGTAGGGWAEIGGTSLGAPLVAAMYALSGNAASVNDASGLYKATSGLYGIIAGVDGVCVPLYLCSGGIGYNGPSGMGTPYGLTAFTSP
jgi:subtilase family serine protease